MTTQCGRKKAILNEHLLPKIIKKYLADKGWETCSRPTWTYINNGIEDVSIRIDEADGGDKWEGFVTIRVGRTSVEYCQKALIDFHEPQAFQYLSDLLRICKETKHCENCAIKKQAFRAKDRRIPHGKCS